MIYGVLFVVTFSFLAAVASRDLRYPYFDDYLSSLNVREQALITGDDQEYEGSGEPEEYVEGFLDDVQSVRSMPLRTGLKRSKDVTCCALGQLAADKGYHCYAKFYVARIMLRNKNRAHNRKMAFYGRNRVSNYGTKLMRTFEQCVAGRAMVFHKCCHIVAMERKSSPHYDTLQRQKYERKQRVKRTKLTAQIN